VVASTQNSYNVPRNSDILLNKYAIVLLKADIDSLLLAPKDSMKKREKKSSVELYFYGQPVLSIPNQY
jgi:adenine-specific DNA methylase